MYTCVMALIKGWGSSVQKSLSVYEDLYVLYTTGVSVYTHVLLLLLYTCRFKLNFKLIMMNFNFVS